MSYNVLKYNGISYVLKGSSEDNGQYDHYYYKQDVSETYNILYEGQRGTLFVKTTYFIDADTNLKITRDYYQWILKYGINNLAGTCFTTSEELWLLDIINNHTYDRDIPINDNNNDNNNSLDNILNGNNPLFGGTSDELPSNNKNNKEENTGKNIFDNTTGDNTDKNRISKLPVGADVNSPDIFGTDDYKDNNNPYKENYYANKGTSYPIIRINDHYFILEEIEKFSMETGYYKDYTDYKKYGYLVSGFLPTMRLILKLQNPDLLKENHIKQGDRCAVFFTSSHNMIKSMRCDFKITSAVTNDVNQNRLQKYTTYIIRGELYIPDLYNEGLKYNFDGTSRDSMIDAAKKLRLSFFFSDPTNTTSPDNPGGDTMVWCCNKTIRDFILDNTAHAWKDPNSFYESFIDPRYGLAFLNINYILGQDGLDGDLDLSFFIKSYTNYYNTLDAKDSSIIPAPKIFTNINGGDAIASTIYHINSWKYINRAQLILDFIGLNYTMHLKPLNEVFYNTSKSDSISTALDENLENNTSTNDESFNTSSNMNTSTLTLTGEHVTAYGKQGYSIDYTMCYNPTKWNPNPGPNDVNLFYVLVGPARNLSYKTGYEDDNEAVQSQQVGTLETANMQSEGDAEFIAETGTNEMSSGNTHKFYNLAYEHNLRNLLLLLKLVLQVELNGANLAITRGEKIPVLMADVDLMINYIYKKETKILNKDENNFFDSNINENISTIRDNLAKYLVDYNNKLSDIKNNINSSISAADKDSVTELNNLIFEAESGWYIIDGIEWVYDSNLNTDTGTLWRTNVKITRREWPIPNSRSKENNDLNIKNYVLVGNTGSIKLAAHDLYNYGYNENDVVGLYQEIIKDGQKLTPIYDNSEVLLYEGEDGKIYDENFKEIQGVTVTYDPSNNLNKPTENNVNGNKESNVDDNTATLPGNNVSTNIYLSILNSAGALLSNSFMQDVTKNSNIPLTGLKDYMKTIYRAIEQATDNHIKLVSARRYAVDAYGNKVEGNAFIINSGYYKCMSSTGDILYFKSNNSRHLYGEAFDIINDGIDFIELMTNYIMKDSNVLLLFYTYGVSAYIEQSIDDTGVTTKHYHIGTDTTKQKEFWASVKAILGTDVIPNTRITFSNYTKNNSKLTEVVAGQNQYE